MIEHFISIDVLCLLMCFMIFRGYLLVCLGAGVHDFYSFFWFFLIFGLLLIFGLTGFIFVLPFSFAEIHNEPRKSVFTSHIQFLLFLPLSLFFCL